MTTTYFLHPHVGADPITFSMSPSEVAKGIGRPKRVQKNDLGERDEIRDNVGIRYALTDGRVVEIAFTPRAQLEFKGHLLFDEEDLISFLIKYDPNPYEFLGFLVFFELGITVTGFHDEDSSQRAITVFRDGRWDEFRDQLVPYHPE